MVCADCAAGALHGGTPAGTISVLHGLKTYIAEPRAGTAPKGLLVVLTDAFGYELINNQILCDNLASKGGFKVLMPDFFNGNWLPHDLLYSIDTVLDKESGITSKLPSGFRVAFSFLPFLFRNRVSVTKPRIVDFFKAVRASSNLRIGALGYCWGGLHVTDLARGEPTTDDGRPLFDAAHVAHPSMLTIPADIEPITLPYSVAHAGKDHNITPEVAAKYRAALDGKPDTEFVEYPGAKHGFAVRGDPNDETEKQQGMEAEEQALRWFAKYLAKS